MLLGIVLVLVYPHDQSRAITLGGRADNHFLCSSRQMALGLLDVSANVPVSALPLIAALAPEGHTYTIMDENVEALATVGVESNRSLLGILIHDDSPRLPAPAVLKSLQLSVTLSALTPSI